MGAVKDGGEEAVIGADAVHGSRLTANLGTPKHIGDTDLLELGFLLAHSSSKTKIHWASWRQNQQRAAKVLLTPQGGVSS